MPGHLATLTSQAENDFVWQTFQGIIQGDEYWLGGFQVRWARRVDRGWRWITRERWRFTNWGPGEPNDAGSTPGVEDGEENSLHFPYWTGAGEWNDVPGQVEMLGYIIEYEEIPDQASVPIRPKDIHLESKLTTTWAILKQAH